MDEKPRVSCISTVLERDDGNMSLADARIEYESKAERFQIESAMREEIFFTADYTSRCSPITIVRLAASFLVIVVKASLLRL